MAVSGFLLYNCHNNHIMKGNEAGACAAPKPRTRAVTALDPHLRLLLALLTKLGSRCCLEERGSRAWCRCASGPADEPPMTASGGNLIGDEIKRNEQCPHEADLRRLSLREKAAFPDAKHPGKAWE